MHYVSLTTDACPHISTSVDVTVNASQAILDLRSMVTLFFVFDCYFQSKMQEMCGELLELGMLINKRERVTFRPCFCKLKDFTIE